MYNTTSKVETKITTNTADQQFPKIYGDIIVWQDYRETKFDYFNRYITGLTIYAYNLTAKTEMRLPLPEKNAYNPKKTELNASCLKVM